MTSSLFILAMVLSVGAGVLFVLEMRAWLEARQFREEASLAASNAAELFDEAREARKEADTILDRAQNLLDAVARRVPAPRPR